MTNAETKEYGVELKPCPLCAADMVLDQFVGWDGEDLPYKTVTHVKAACPLAATQFEATGDNIAAWNRRASDKPSEAVAWLDPWGNVSLHRRTADSRPLFLTTQPAESAKSGDGVTDEQVKRAAQEFLSHKGEHPWRVTRRGAELWEDYVPAMRAALTAALGDHRND